MSSTMLQNGMFSGLDIDEPRDTELVSNLPRHIRETRRALSVIKVLRVNLEAGTERGDLVFPDKETGVWLRSHAGIPERARFFGVAFPEDRAVVVGAIAIVPDWHWKRGETLYLSDTMYGKMTHRETNHVAGMAVTGQLVMFNIFQQQWNVFVEEFKQWVEQEAIEIMSLKEYIAAMADKVKETEALINQVWDFLQNAANDLIPRIEALQGIYGAAQVFVYDVPNDVQANTPITINASYHFQHASLVIMLNGMVTNEWSKVNPIIGEFSSRIRFTQVIPGGTQIIGIIFTEAYASVVPEVVVSDTTLVGDGTMTQPLGVNPAILAQLADLSNTITNIINDIGAAYDFVVDANITTGSTSDNITFDTMTIAGVVNSFTRMLPIANNLMAGLMPATMVSQVAQMSDRIDSIAGIMIRIVDDTIPANALPAALYAAWAAQGMTLVEGATIENMALNIRWTYRNGVWYGPYESVVVRIATNLLPGIVQGAEDTTPNRGKVFVEPNGQMSLLGYDNIMQQISNLWTATTNAASAAAKLWTTVIPITLPYVSGTAFTVPAYTMGQNQLVVFINGMRTNRFTEVSPMQLSISEGVDGTGTMEVIIDCFRT